MSEIMIEALQSLRLRAERLEQDAAELRQELDRVTEALESPSTIVARYVIDGEMYEITQADIMNAKSGLVKSWNESAVYDLAAIKKVANKLRERSPEERKQYFFETVEAIREEALANGTAIDSKL